MPGVVEEYLEALVSTGGYGNKTQDAIAELVRERLKALIADGTLRRRPNTEPL
jgi:hypothetical protein